jgi:hypothetical protein
MNKIVSTFLWSCAAAVYPVIFLWSKNWEEVFKYELLFNFSLFLIAAFVLYLFYFKILRNPFKASIASSLTSIMFFCFGYFFDCESISFKWLNATFRIWNYYVLLPVWVILFFLLIMGIRKLNESKLSFLYSLQIIIIGTLISCSLFNLFSIAFGKQKASVVTIDSATKKPNFCPNMYYIILDEYGREDVLKELYNFDNVEFINFLKKNNFSVAEKSCSNYCCNMLSIPSSFSMTYIDIAVEDAKAEANAGKYSPSDYVNKSPLISYLKEAGYTFVNIANGEVFTSTIDGTDIQCGQYFIGPFTLGIIDKTFVGVFFRKFSPNILHTIVRSEIVLKQFDFLKKSIHLKSPHFVFCHILCPHAPFMFERDGTRRYIKAPDEDMHRKKLYAEQVQYVNTRMMNILQELIEVDPNSVVVVQGDHGPAYDNVEFFYGNVDDSKKGLIKERMAILNAYRFPKNNSPFIPRDITPVNSWRIILNHYFTASLPLLPNSCFWSYPPYIFKIIQKLSPQEIDGISLQ